MNLDEITKRDAYLQTLPMGPKRWKADAELTRQKIACKEYLHSSQKMSFVEWLGALGSASKTYDTVWANDQVRAEYYEGQPEAWIDSYDQGLSPKEAIDSDRDYWE